MLKALKIRLYPNQSQRELFDQYFGVTRFVYNVSLQHKQDIYNYNLSIKESINFYDNKLKSSITELNKHIVNLKSSICPWLSSVNSKVQQQSIIDLDKAYNNFFKKKSKYPKFKSKYNNHQSCRFPIDAIAKNCFENDKLSLVKGLTNVSFKCSDYYKDTLRVFRNNVKSITVVKTCTGKYFASVLIDINVKNKKCGNGVVGIDLGVKTFATLSNNERIEQENWIRNNQKRLSKLQRRMSKKKKGSKNRNKARVKLAKTFEKLNNRKDYFLHQIVNRLIDENQVICLETLKVINMLSNHRLARTIQEKNLGKFVLLLEQKAIVRDCKVVKIDQWFASSKTCSCCGHVNDKLTLKDREWTCVNCNVTHDRDHNAAVNILKEGLKILKKIELKIGKNNPDSGLSLKKVLKDCGDEALVLSVKQ